jgi:5-hydroxyisourate hydrolase
VARLSTHVLDLSRGVPAAGVAIELRRVGSGDAVASTVTNADGRTDTPLLEGERIEPGLYDLVFHAGDYFRGLKVPLPAPPVFDVIVVRVGIADERGHYHVPLLLSPYAYSTYRGS